MRKYSKEQLVQALNSNSSLRGVLIDLELAPYGGNYESIRNAIQSYKLNIEKELGKNIVQDNIKREATPKRSTEEYLVLNGPSIANMKLRQRLLLEGFFTEYRCAMCEIMDWNGKPIQLQLDHTNGNNRDNRIENLRLLCPNCHAKTETYTAKKRTI